MGRREKGDAEGRDKRVGECSRRLRRRTGLLMRDHAELARVVHVAEHGLVGAGSSSCNEPVTRCERGRACNQRTGFISLL